MRPVAFILGSLICLPLSAFAFNSKCFLKLDACVVTQGTSIPSDDVLDILDRCEVFTRGDIGRIMLRTSGEKLLAQAQGKSTLLTHAWMSFNYLHGSPLRFDRKSKIEETNYMQIKRSCMEVERDFNDDSKWRK